MLALGQNSGSCQLQAPLWAVPRGLWTSEMGLIMLTWTRTFACSDWLLGGLIRKDRLGSGVQSLGVFWPPAQVSHINGYSANPFWGRFFTK